MLNGTPTTLQSENEASGFFGTIRHHAEPNRAWAYAMKAIANTTHCPGEAVRDFLDSRYGRHFADEVANALFSGCELAAAIDETIKRWMDWRIDAHIERELGIPRGLPYLTGSFACTRPFSTPTPTEHATASRQTCGTRRLAISPT